MKQITIRPGVVIDEAENVEIAIRNLCGKDASAEVIGKFIDNEAGTMYYVDSKLNSSTCDDGNKDYLWLDTGYTSNGCPILISLKKGYGGYVGHYTDTVKGHTNYLKNRYYSNRKYINSNYSRFTDKLSRNTEQRRHAHIEDKNEYIMSSLNQCDEDSDFVKMLKLIGQQLPEANEASVEVNEEVEEAAVQEFERFNAKEEAVTIELLLNEYEKLEDYVEELLTIIEENKAQSGAEIAELRRRNAQLQTSVLNMRGFYDKEQERAGLVNEVGEGEAFGGRGVHELLNNKKILVVGDSCIGDDIMAGIAKDYGFEKKDFEFETDYEKVKSQGSRVNRSSRYEAVIIGRIPHSIAQKGDYTNPVTMFKETFNCCVVDARNKAGALKVTRTSYREALDEIKEYLQRTA